MRLTTTIHSLLSTSAGFANRSLRQVRRATDTKVAKRILATGLLAASSMTATASTTYADETTGVALREFVNRPDSTYKWVEKQTGEYGPSEWTRLCVTSQTWQKHPWKHLVCIFKPKSLKAVPSHAIVLISGGGWSKDWPVDGPDKQDPPKEAAWMSQLAEATGSVVCVFQHIPHQPLFDGLVEDEIISKTFVHFLETGDADWPLLMPMVKSASKCMDAVSEYSEQHWGKKLDRFTVTGGSKRGWTTWLVSAVDKRVVSLAPVVIDMLNLDEQMDHHLDTWGEYSEQIADYSTKGIPQKMSTERGKELLRLVDPYDYRHHILQPKILVFGTNDRYWPVDACNLYWQQLIGQKHLIYAPNQGHGIQDAERLLGGWTALFRSQNGGPALPVIGSQVQLSDDTIELDVVSDRIPQNVLLWKATSDTRDFRQSKWESVDCQIVDGHWRAKIERAPGKAVALFGEVVLEQKPWPARFATPMTVVPKPNGR